jgi:predicted phosphodiesterase
MRIFALSDLHADFEVNRQWIASLSTVEYRDDVLILAGDVCDSIQLLEFCMSALASRFAKVLYVPGNHELWVFRDEHPGTSLEKFQQVSRVIEDCGASMQPFHCNGLSIVPLLGWYDYSFGEPSSEVLEAWMDYRACRWPDHLSLYEVTEHFLRLNHGALTVTNDVVISFSHFLPRLDIMPNYVSGMTRMLYPVLGSSRLEAQIRQIKPAIHVYGHSHLNRMRTLDGVLYVNNAFGYPHESGITAKRLVCIYDRNTQSLLASPA